MNIVALIPARYQSSRLPGKPLLQFGEYTMIQRVYLQTNKVDFKTSVRYPEPHPISNAEFPVKPFN